MVEQYEANVTLLTQQKGSKLRGTVSTMQTTGKRAFIEQFGATSAIRRTSRHGDSPLISTPSARRALDPGDYEWGDLIDDADKLKLLIEPMGPYSLNAAMAMGRSMDEEIIRAVSDDSSVTGTTTGGTTTTALPAAQTIAVDYVESGAATNSNLTVGKLRRARDQFGINDVDMDETLHLVTSQSQITSLLRDDEVTSADFNTVRALVNGEINTYMGFEFHRTQLLTVDGNSIRTCIAYPASGVMLGIGQDIKSRIAERPDKSFSTYVYYSMSIGATRLEEF
jgi:hypothetical protein